MGEKFRSRALKFPGLISGSTMDWFQKWPKEALIQVASHFLADFHVSASNIRYIHAVGCNVVPEYLPFLSILFLSIIWFGLLPSLFLFRYCKATFLLLYYYSTRINKAVKLAKNIDLTQNCFIHTTLVHF